MSGSPGTRILVVDDDDGGRYLKSHILRQQRLRGRRSGNRARGDRAISAVASPDLVLLDIALPDIDGSRRLPPDQGGISQRRRAADIGGDHQPA